MASRVNDRKLACIHNILILQYFSLYYKVLVLLPLLVFVMFEKYCCKVVQKILSEGGQLIDVRSTIEFSHGALRGAVNMPIDNFQYLKDDIDSSRPVLLYCRTGARSGMVKNYLDRLGFDQVHNIGGIRQFIDC